MNVCGEKRLAAHVFLQGSLTCFHGGNGSAGRAGEEHKDS